MMSLDWLTWSNPVSIWWCGLLIVSTVNIGLWVMLHRRLPIFDQRPGFFRIEPLILLCAAYVFGCAFRAVLPRADIERICLFDTWLSNVFLGRSVATVAEICFAAQCAIVLHYLARSARSPGARTIANAIVPLIVVAECFSWYGVITTDYLGNTIENSLWTVTFLLIATGLLLLVSRFEGMAKAAISVAVVGIVGYATFMLTVDVPMYFGRWQADLASGKSYFGLLGGLHDASTRWVVTQDFAQWRDEMPWKSLYFSVAVWASLALCAFALVKDAILARRVRPARPSPARRRVSASVGAR
jgi:hypothetical protein